MFSVPDFTPILCHFQAKCSVSTASTCFHYASIFTHLNPSLPLCISCSLKFLLDLWPLHCVLSLLLFFAIYFFGCRKMSWQSWDHSLLIRTQPPPHVFQCWEGKKIASGTLNPSEETVDFGSECWSPHNRSTSNIALIEFTGPWQLVVFRSAGAGEDDLGPR